MERVVDTQKIKNLAQGVALILRAANVEGKCQRIETLEHAVEKAMKAKLEFYADYGANNMSEIIAALKARHNWITSYLD